MGSVAMDLYPYFEWFETTVLGMAIRDSLWLFPVIECIHLLGLSLLGGAVLVVDLRLLGLGLRGRSVSEVARNAHPWLVGGLAVMILTGVPLFMSESVKCYYSPPFWYKMGFLLAATVFTFSIRRKVAGGEPKPLTAGLTGVVSLALWFGVGFAGRWIAFY